MLGAAAIVALTVAANASGWGPAAKSSVPGESVGRALAPSPDAGRLSGPTTSSWPTPSSAAPTILSSSIDPIAGPALVATIVPTPPALLTGYRWPLEHARITNAFGVGRPGNEVVGGVTMHDGLDISSFCGARIVAAHDGVVLAAGRRTEAFVGWVGDLGPYQARLDARGRRGGAIAVVIDDGNGYRSIYLHLGLAAVRAGVIVRAGDLIGYEGATGEATGCHLHYALFSPRSRYTIGVDPKVVAESHLPPRKIARIDPLLVLPPLEAGFITWGWGAGGPT